MLKRTLFVFNILFFLSVFTCNAQPSQIKHSRPDGNILETFYQLNDCRIYPAEKVIKRSKITGGVVGIGIMHEQLYDINFDKTKVYLLGKQTVFEEQLRGHNLKEAKVLRSRFNHRNFRDGLFFAFDNDTLYEVISSRFHPVISIKEMKSVGEYLFENTEGQLFIFLDEYRRMSPPLSDSLHIDRSSFRLIADNLFCDKSNIYDMRSYATDETGLPLATFGKIIGKNKGGEITVGDSYCVLGEEVYLRADKQNRRLDLDASSIREYLLNESYSTYLITDGKKVYVYSLDKSGTPFSEITEFYGLDLEPIIPRPAKWYFDRTDYTVYLDTSKRGLRGLYYSKVGFLMYSKTCQNVYILGADGKSVPFKGLLLSGDENIEVHFFDATKDKDDLLPILRFGSSLFNTSLLNLYKENGLDIANLKQVGKSIFYFDGKTLVWSEKIQYIIPPTEESELTALKNLFKSWICEVKHPEKLVMLNERLLTDGENFYAIGRIDHDAVLLSAPFSALNIPAFYLPQGKTELQKAR